MARAYSQDLRDRVIDAAFSGRPARCSAAHFGIAWPRRLSGFAAHARPGIGLRISRAERSAVNSIPIASFCQV